MSALAADDHLFSVLAELRGAKPLRAGLVQRAEDWPWSGLGCRSAGAEATRVGLHPGPIPLPAVWLGVVSQPHTEAELEGMRRSMARGCPDGPASWVQAVANALDYSRRFVHAAGPASSRLTRSGRT